MRTGDIKLLQPNTRVSLIKKLPYVVNSSPCSYLISKKWRTHLPSKCIFRKPRSKTTHSRCKRLASSFLLHLSKLNASKRPGLQELYLLFILLIFQMIWTFHLRNTSKFICHSLISKLDCKGLRRQCLLSLQRKT